MDSPLQDPLPRLAPRAEDSHKGTFGTALVVGGSWGMTGAVTLAGLAALRGGAGLVRLAVASRCLDVVAGFEPSYMTSPLPDDADGRIDETAYDRIAQLAAAATAVALGPGLGRSAGLDRLVARLYRDLRQPMVVDADALNALSVEPEQLSRAGGPRILTPHPGEFARLLSPAQPMNRSAGSGAANSAGTAAFAVEPGSLTASESRSGQKLSGDERQQAAVERAARWGVVIVLKGPHTLVTDGRRQWRNTTGNPGMATGGSGDSLTGLTAALLCQGLDAFDAARLGVYLHGLAGDLAAEELGQVSLIASDLVRMLPKAFLAYQANV